MDDVYIEHIAQNLDAAWADLRDGYYFFAGSWHGRASYQAGLIADAGVRGRAKQLCRLLRSCACDAEILARRTAEERIARLVLDVRRLESDLARIASPAFEWLVYDGTAYIGLVQAVSANEALREATALAEDRGLVPTAGLRVVRVSR